MAYDWGIRAKQKADELALLLLGEKPKGLRGPAAALQGGVKMNQCVARASSTTARARTVHQVKGETHEETIYYVTPHKTKDCPSATWWDGDQAPTEEGRIAFVAATRPRSTFVLFLPKELWERVRTARPKFAAAIETIEPKPQGQRGLSAFF